MMGSKRIKRSEEQWREIFSRHEASGLPVTVFCAQEGISPGVFRRWREALNAAGTPRTRPARGKEATSPAPFIDLGALRAGDSRFQVRLELGGGVVLSVGRS